MSGIEVAGLVLGALPLIISAIESYEKSLDRAVVFFKWKDELGKVLRELWLQHSYYELTLTNLLRDVTSISELDEMMSQINSPLWKSPELAQGLKEKLGAAYKVYIYTVQEIEGYMKTLAAHLDIDHQHTRANELEAIILANLPVHTSQQGQPKFEFRRRVKLTMKRRDIRQLLNNIKDCNQRLDQFIRKAGEYEQLSATTPSGWSSSLSVPLQQIQEYATSLHQVLSRAWSCSAHSTHCVNLLLEHRMMQPRKQRRQLRLRKRNGPASFTVSFKSPLRPKSWYAAEVRVLEDTALSPRKVAFKVTTSTPTGDFQGDDFERLEIIKDLCSTLESHSESDYCFGFCLDLQGQLWGTYQATQRSLNHAEKLVSLDDILFSQSEPRQKLTLEDRYILAVTITSSFLQLHKTPWLSDIWSKRDIRFASTMREQRQVVDIKHPFVTQTYPKAVGCQADSVAYGMLGPTASSAHSDSLNLLSLAKMLLEIRFNDCVESQRRREDMGPDNRANEATDLQVLKRWMAEEEGNLSFAFRDAVSYCMRCFADPGADLCDPGFRQTLVDSVVVPLLDELHMWQEGPSWAI